MNKSIDELQEEKTKILIFDIFLLVVVAFAIYFSLNIIPLIFSLILTYLALSINKNLHTKINEGPNIVYYSLILLTTLIFSLEYKSSKKILMLVMTNVLICISLFITQSRISASLFVFMNFYLILDIMFHFVSQEMHLDGLCACL